MLILHRNLKAIHIAISSVDSHPPPQKEKKKKKKTKQTKNVYSQVYIVHLIDTNTIQAHGCNANIIVSVTVRIQTALIYSRKFNIDM